MKISVVGCGYLGAVHATSLASLGHEVIGVDHDEDKVRALARGSAPFFEPGLPALLLESMETGRLRFTTDLAEAAGAAVHFICVGTPQRVGDYAADLTYVDAAFEALLPFLSAGDVVVGKSTVPVGTAERLSDRIETTVPGAMLVWNPEFLREGHAIDDTLHPDRIVYGVGRHGVGHDGVDHEGDRAAATAVLDEVYATPLSAGVPRIVTDFATAELVKVAANSFLATKISFINAMAELCEATGADVTHLADAIGHDKRIGRHFLNAGLGFGGGCLPKDIRAFMARAGELGVDQALTFLREVDTINLRRRERMVTLAREEFGGSVDGRSIAVLGIAFKPDSDDVRDSPALDVAAQLRAQGAEVRVTDPEGIENARRIHPELTYVDDVEDAVDGSELILLLTEWKEYVALDPRELAKSVVQPRILDGRNALDPDVWRDAGWTYRALGRPHEAPLL